MFNFVFTFTTVLAGISFSVAVPVADPDLPALEPGPVKISTLPALEPGPVKISTLPAVIPKSGSSEEGLDEMHDFFMELTDKVAEFAEEFITGAQSAFEELLKSGKLETLNKDVGDALKEAVQKGKEDLQQVLTAVHEVLIGEKEIAASEQAAKSAEAKPAN